MAKVLTKCQQHQESQRVLAHFGQFMGIIRVAPHSLSKTESQPAERAIAQILMAVRGIAQCRKSAPQALVLTNGAQ